MSAAPAFEIHSDLSPTAEMAKAFEAAPDIFSEEVMAAVWQAELLTLREVKELTPVGVGGGGGLRGSFFAADPEKTADGVLGMVASPLAYAVPVELGSKPHFPPLDPLIDWVSAKFGVGGAEAKSIAYAVALKIAAKGTKGAFMMKGALEKAEPQFPGIFAGVPDRVFERLAAQGGGR
ncbi:MAG: hypothetical protein RIB45_17855 [Marivibrio sp.]|uniref:hypothetical protein n=1 Tax=Marivibrio sp. TaxID=2039719 RepID=UPI0032EB9442